MRNIILSIAIITGVVCIGWGGWNQDQQVGKLTVDNGIYATSFVPTNTTNMLYNNTGTLYWNGSTIGSGGGSSGSGGWQTDSTYVYPSLTTTNIGIGTSVPTQKLQVIGTVKASAFIGDGNGITGNPATAYTDRLKWDGGSTGLTAATGRTSLGLGTIATAASGDYLAIGGTAANSSALNGHADTYFQVAGSYLTAVTADAPLSGSGTSGSHLVISTAGTWSGNAGTATALAANGANCSAGNYPLGVDASGAVEGCTASGSGTGSPGGSTTQLQFNNAGVFDGVGGSVYTGTTLSFTGNIGIGTVNPAIALGIGSTNQFKVSSAGAVTAVSFSGPLTGNVTGNASGTALTVTQAAQTAITSLGTLTGLYVNGNVGIGSSAPAGALDVATGAVCINHVCNSAWPAGGSSQWLTNGSVGIGTTSNVGIGSSAPANKLDIWGVGTTSATNSLNIHDSTGVNLVNILDNGNVGINSTAPQAKLDVEGSVYVGNGNIGIASISPQQKLDVNGAAIFNGTGDTYLNPTSGNVGVGTSAPTAKLYVNGAIYSTGNIGIGTLAPRQAIDVIGTVRATSFWTGNVGIGTSGATACVCLRYEGGICTSGSCT
jgi:hypothetical protein